MHSAERSTERMRRSSVRSEAGRHHGEDAQRAESR